MDNILSWGVDIIIQIQQFRSPFLDLFFTRITSLGDSIFYMIIIPFLFWCVDRKSAAYLLIIFYISYWSNAAMKNFLMQPRPFDLNPAIKVGKAGGYGLPSGHAQGSFIFWTFLSVWIRKAWFYIIAIIIMLLIALSRLYLGLHFPTDILGAWFLGGIVIILFFLLYNKAEELIARTNRKITIPLIILVTSLLAFVKVSMWTVYPMGILAGFSTGLLCGNPYDFSIVGPWYKRLLRFILGLTGSMFILFPLKVYFPGDASLFFLAGIYLRYFIFGFWVSFIAPGLFKMLRI